MVKLGFLLLDLFFFAWAGTVFAQEDGEKRYVIVFPSGNEMETESGGGLHYHNYEWGNGGDALDFDTYLTADSAQYGRLLAVARSRETAADPLPVRLELVQLWQVDSLLASGDAPVSPAARNRRFLRGLREIVGEGLEIGKEQPERPYTGAGESRVFSGLVPVSYRGEPCLLLWDEAERCTKSWATEVTGNASVVQVPGQEPQVAGVRYLQYSFDYSFRGMRQMALCRFPGRGYVLLLLTQPMVEMD